MKDFEIIPHTADLQIKAYGKNEKELFKNALIGMFQSVEPITDNSNNCNVKNGRLECFEFEVKHKIELNSSNLELLLIDFLSEALYLSDINNEAYLDIEISELSQKNISATLKGIKIFGFRVFEIKAVTYHDLKIQYSNGYYQADIVFDI